MFLLCFFTTQHREAPKPSWNYAGRWPSEYILLQTQCSWNTIWFDFPLSSWWGGTDKKTDLIVRWVPSKWLISLLSLPGSRWPQRAGTPECFLLKSRQMFGQPGIGDRLFLSNPKLEWSCLWGEGTKTQVLELISSSVLCWAHQVRTWYAR